MGTFRVQMEIGDPDGERFQTVEALVDTGATYTSAPASLLRQLGIAPRNTGAFILADGSRSERQIGQTWVRLDDESNIVPVVFADERSTPLLGAVTLEIFRLGVDPVGKRLIPVDGLLLVIEEEED